MKFFELISGHLDQVLVHKFVTRFELVFEAFKNSVQVGHLIELVIVQRLCMALVLRLIILS